MPQTALPLPLFWTYAAALTQRLSALVPFAAMRLPRRLARYLKEGLQAAESMVRRLLVLEALASPLPEPPPAQHRTRLAASGPRKSPRGQRHAAFPLSEPMPRFDSGEAHAPVLRVQNKTGVRLAARPHYFHRLDALTRLIADPARDILRMRRFLARHRRSDPAPGALCKRCAVYAGTLPGLDARELLPLERDALFHLQRKAWEAQFAYDTS